MVTQDAKYKAGNKIIESAYVAKPFDEAKAELEASGYEIISLEDNAKLRIAKGANREVSLSGNYTKEGFLYVPKKGIFLVRNSPIMANAKEATDCHRNGKEFYLTQEQVEKALADSIEVSGKSIPTNRFGDEELTNYAFGKTAKAYGEFLKQAGINEMPVWLANITDKAFAKQAWLCRLGGSYGSGLDGYGGLYCRGAVRGVRLASTEGAKPAKISTPNLKKILKYSRQFVPSVAKKDFEKGLEAIFRKQ